LILEYCCQRRSSREPRSSRSAHASCPRARTCRASTSAARTTLRALEAGLETFPGCVVVISHDRWFLDRIATHILAFEDDSQVRFFEGNVTDYEEFRHMELGTSADLPHRIRYKRLATA
jgi:hypothetical protein